MILLDRKSLGIQVVTMVGSVAMLEVKEQDADSVVLDSFLAVSGPTWYLWNETGEKLDITLKTIKLKLKLFETLFIPGPKL